MPKIKRVNAAVVSINNFHQTCLAAEEKGRKTATDRIEQYISQSLGEVCEVYRINDNTYICISDDDIRGYISQFKDTVGFSEINEKYPLKVTVKYMNNARRWSCEGYKE